MELAPSETAEIKAAQPKVLLIACGALAREIVDLVERNHWTGFDIQCLPAKWHNTPQFIVPGVREKIRAANGQYEKIYVLYGDCGTGGLLDSMLAEEGAERIDGPHCYAFFSGNAAFAANSDHEFTAFYLTDYIVRQFDKLIWQGLGLDRYPELRDSYFGNYTKVVFLAQTEDQELQVKAQAAADKLGLGYEYRFTGYGELETELAQRA
jgi:hypothetical protein